MIVKQWMRLGKPCGCILRQGCVLLGEFFGAVFAEVSVTQIIKLLNDRHRMRLGHRY